MAASEPAPAGASPPAAPILDIEAGAARLMGNRALYRRILARFLNDYRGAAVAVRNALGAHEPVLAFRLVHTLKGAAGMIEAGTLHRSALALENALRAGAPETEDLLLELEEALGAVVRELERMPVAEDAVTAARDIGADAPGADVLQRLRSLLDSGDGAALDLVKAAHASLDATLGASVYAQLSAAVAGFDYAHALELLGEPERRTSDGG